jgi:hypothetical protein
VDLESGEREAYYVGEGGLYVGETRMGGRADGKLEQVSLTHLHN